MKLIISFNQKKIYNSSKNMFKRFYIRSAIIKKEHINFYKDNGFIIFGKIFKEKELNLLNSSIEFFADDAWHNIMNPDRVEFLLSQSFEKLKKLKNQNDKILFIQKALATSNLYKSYLLDFRIKKILNKLLNAEVVGLMSHVIFKHKNSKFSKMAWFPHQDNSYAQMPKNAYITTNLFIHNANKRNGTLYIYPGSHKVGLKNYEKYRGFHAKSNNKPGNKTLMPLKEENRLDLIVKRGDFLLMNGNLVHGSYPNLSKTLSRHLLSFNYGIAGKKFFPGITAQRKAIKFN